MGLRVGLVVLAVLASVLAVFCQIRPEFAQPFLDYMQYVHMYMWICVLYA